MRITESKLKQIIREEARRVLGESDYTNYINGRNLVQMLKDAGEDRTADRVADNLHIRRDMEMSMEVYRQPNGDIALYVNGNKLIEVIPKDVAARAGIRP